MADNHLTRGITTCFIEKIKLVAKNPSYIQKSLRIVVKRSLEIV